jgi:CHAT domain-containing protein
MTSPLARDPTSFPIGSLNYLLRIRLISLALFLVTLSSPTINGQSTGITPAPPTDVTTLESNAPIERTISGKPRHTYFIALVADQYIKIIIEQRGLDVGARLYGLDQHKIEDFDGELRSNKPETVEFIPKVSGTYRLDIINKNPNLPPGKYEIRIAERHPASEKEIAEEQARILSSESRALFDAGKYKESQQAVEKALEIDRKESGLNSPVTVLDLVLLIRVNGAQGKYEESIKAGEEVLAIRKNHPEPNSFIFGITLNQIANSYASLEDYPKSIEYYQQAYGIFKTEVGETSPAVAAALMNLGDDYKLLGDNSQALELYERALDIQEKAAREVEYNTACVLTSIGAIHTEAQEYAKAEAVLQRAIVILEKIYKPDNPRTLEALSSLALCHTRAHNFDRAEELYLRILAIREKSLGTDNALVATDAFDLGNLYAARNDLEKAEPFFRRALDIREKNYGKESPLVGRVLTNLALLRAARGDVTESLELQRRANEITERSVSLNLTIGSERQKLVYLQSLFEQTNQSVFLQTKYAPDNVLAANLAATTVLRQKGRVLDAAASNLVELRQRFAPQDSALLDKFNKLSKQTAELMLNGAKDTPLTEYQSNIKALTDEREKIEGEISRRAAGFFPKSQPVSLSAIQALIPADSALIEFAVYTPSSSFIPDETPSDKKRYVAYVLRSRGDIKWKDLGDAREINESVDAIRQALRDPQRKDVQQIARDADKKIMQPLRDLAGDATRFLISPDGELNLIPFEALVDESGRYLVQSYSFAYLTSGRDLLRMSVARASKSKELLIANPQFGESPAERLIAANKSRGPSVPQRRSVTAARSLSETYFAPLGGTLQEARAIQSFFPDALFLNGTAATETALKKANAPRVLHIATHGFFLSEPPLTGKESMSNPLLRSGLALANANLHGSHNGAGDDGILTALEASGLNLWGTKLVVLSACDTGVGEVRNGEGVYGLRRAFVLAGSESLVMSLWPVSDYSTRRLMTDYYRNLKQGLGRAAALRQVQLHLLKTNPELHPFYWANFIESGEWANLNGER